ncbi:YciI family protein [Tunicatimonas pelagia]|uniref:YciI family protein n=1 Tax=Tunicatimonas pelagia TaxID=931531 RepID=UPI002665AC32|nr:YciI family protein [Tunicatimonas pelagia]WKN43079.1 YciI family protein [Tunicatimonas pelagia]
MKEFMMIFIGGTAYEELGLSPEQLQHRMEKWFTWDEKLKQQGILRGGEALHAKVKRVVGPNRIESDGPFVESKELIGGYITVAANSFEEVVKIAQDFPDYDIDGSVEIREVMKLDQYE